MTSALLYVIGFPLRFCFADVICVLVKFLLYLQIHAFTELV